MQSRPLCYTLSFGALAGLLLLTGCSHGRSRGQAGAGTPQPPAPAAATVPAFDHIVVILMENHSYADIVGNRGQAPYINQLADRYGLARGYADIGHPSLPNYLALTGAGTFGVNSDCTTCFIAAPNLVVDRVEASGRSWKAYMESMPSACYRGDHGDYVQRHDPFYYYDDIRTNPTECAKIVPYGSLAGDLQSAATTPSFVWITPNLQHDMHDGSIQQGDRWLQQNVSPLLDSPAFTAQRSLLVIVWDEGSGSDTNHVPALLIGRGVKASYRSDVAYTHYSLVKTIEAAWGLRPLTDNDAAATPMSDFFGAGRGPSPSPLPSQRERVHWK